MTPKHNAYRYQSTIVPGKNDAIIVGMVHISAISIVDDDASVRESLLGLLRSLGYTVTIFAGAEDFLLSPELKQTDCLFLDVQMPGMSGIELQARLRKELCSLPIIFITAHGDDRTRRQAIGGGAVAFLVKPIDEEMVLNALELALKK
jgi:FixJ family two-component response regulator